jgi:hypothetical protein
MGDQRLTSINTLQRVVPLVTASWQFEQDKCTNSFEINDV